MAKTINNWNSANWSLFNGLARVLDIGGVFEDLDDPFTGEDENWVTLASDWYVVGADLHCAINSYSLARVKDRSIADAMN